MRQAVEDFISGVSAYEYAKTHAELGKALAFWGNT